MIGDGMGLAQVHAAYTANHGTLNMERAMFVGLSKTQSQNKYETDSGAGGTALSTGKKTMNNFIGIDASGQATPTILELAEKQGLSTGLVVTSEMIHATPAAFIAHVPDRYMYNEIAEHFTNSGIDIFIGGGRAYFEDSAAYNISDSLRSKSYDIVYSLDDIEPTSPNNIGCLVSDFYLPRFSEGRGDYLPLASGLAMKKLAQNKKGFFLMIEGSQIDWGGHSNDIDFVLEETLDFDKAVGAAFDFADTHPGTLVVVTADHETGGLSITDGDIESGALEVKFNDTGHTGIMVPVFAYGTGAEKFAGIYHNTEIFQKIVDLLKIND